MTGTRQTATEYIDCLERRDWPALTALLADDATYELPQTRERVHGKGAFLRFNVEFPGDWHLTIRRVVAEGRDAALWLDVRVGAEQRDACVWLEVSGSGLITRIVDYWPEAYDPPPGREHLVERY